MYVKGDLLDFAVFLEGCFLVVSLLLFEGSRLGFSPKVVDIFLAWGVSPLYVPRKLLVPTDGDRPPRELESSCISTIDVQQLRTC